MSDLISSQTQSPVSNDAFESLIDLLASDGIDESPSRHQANVSLRDPSGKLDFDKIRLMFQKPRRGEEKKRVALSLLNDESDSDDEHQSHSSTVPSRSSSMSPQPVERAPAGHRRSSTFGNQPWTPIYENVTESKVVDVPLTRTHQPLAFHELNTALAGAQEQVKSLRQQYDTLRDFVSKRWGTEIREPVSIAVNTDEATDKRAEILDGQAQSSVVSLSSDVPTEIAALSESEAKMALTAFVHSLNLSTSAIVELANSSTSGVSPLPFYNPTRQHDVASISRALKFLGTVDELVWRRALSPHGPRTLLPVNSEENVVSLLARLELWERAVRRSSRF